LLFHYVFQIKLGLRLLSCCLFTIWLFGLIRVNRAFEDLLEGRLDVVKVEGISHGLELLLFLSLGSLALSLFRLLLHDVLKGETL
jgi:hypothetical protein